MGVLYRDVREFSVRNGARASGLFFGVVGYMHGGYIGVGGYGSADG